MSPYRKPSVPAECQCAGCTWVRPKESRLRRLLTSPARMFAAGIAWMFAAGIIAAVLGVCGLDEVAVYVWCLGAGPFFVGILSIALCGAVSGLRFMIEEEDRERGRK